MTKLIIVIPGPTEWNAIGRIQGRLDIPLSADGKRHIPTIISGLTNLKGVKMISAIYSSQLSRSLDTATEIGKIFNLKVNKLSELDDLNQGVWQGLLEKQIQKRYKKVYNI
jgi:broad specificity phosphatase PhoE